MKRIQKIISVVLLFAILFSTTGVQCAIHQCMQSSQESKTLFFAENPDNCCAKEAEVATSSCCETAVQKTDTCCNKANKSQSKDNIQTEKCCNTNVYFYKLNTNVLAQEQRSEFFISDLFLAVIFFQPLYSLSLQPVLITEKYTPPDILKSGKYLPTLYSQFRI